MLEDLMKIHEVIALEHVGRYMKLGGRGLVGYVFPPLMFDLSQASGLFLVVFQVYKDSLVVLVLILV